jgi:hypothetical protein
MTSNETPIDYNALWREDQKKFDQAIQKIVRRGDDLKASGTDYCRFCLNDDHKDCILVDFSMGDRTFKTHRECLVDWFGPPRMWWSRLQQESLKGVPFRQAVKGRSI